MRLRAAKVIPVAGAVTPDTAESRFRDWHSQGNGLRSLSLDSRCMNYLTIAPEVLLQVDSVAGWIEDLIDAVITFLPRLVGALLILVVGWIVGVVVAAAIKRAGEATQLDHYTRNTPIGRTLSGADSDAPVAGLLGAIGKWFIIALAVLAAADVLAIPVLSEWIQTAVAYIPAFIAGLLIIVLGFVVADFVGDMISNTEAATQTAYTDWFAAGVRVFLYFTVVVVGLDTMGIDVELLYIFAQAIAWGLAAALALGVGIALGWGGHGYVADHLGRWMGQAKDATPSPSSTTTTGDDDDD